MLHIIILNKNYFPSKLNMVKPSDRVIVLASPDGAIPVSAYQDESLKNMEVKLLPELKDTASQDGKNILRITQAMLIGQLTATEKDFEIYTDDNYLLKALAPFLMKKPAAKRKSTVKPSEKKVEMLSENIPVNVVAESKRNPKERTAKKPLKKTSEPKTEIVKADETTEVTVEEGKTKKNRAEVEKKTSKVAKADVKTKPAKLPTQAEVKRVLGAANSSYAKPIMEVIKKSNQITFEMDLRMKLVEAGMDANQCKDLAKSINEEFGKMLPASM